MLAVINRQKGEAECIIPRRDIHYEENIIKVRVIGPEDSKVRLGLDYSKEYFAKKGDNDLENVIVLAMDETIEFIHVTDKWRGNVKVTVVNIQGEKAKLEFEYDHEGYVARMEEVYNAMIKENKPEQF